MVKLTSETRFILLIIFILWLGFTGYGQVKEKHVAVENLRSEWFVSDENDQFVPYVSDVHNPSYIHLFLNLDKFSEYHLSLSVPRETSLFIDNQIVDYYENAGMSYLSVDSLRRKDKKNKILISIFSKKNLPENLQTIVVDFSPNRVGSTEENDFQSDMRPKYTFDDFGILSILIVVILGIAVRTSHGSIFNEYFSIKNLLTLKPKSEILYSTSLFSTASLSYIFLYSFVGGFALINLIAWHNSTLLIQSGFVDTFELLILTLVVAITIGLIIIMKYPLVKITTNVFMFRHATAVHFYEYLRFAIIISSILFFISIANSFTHGLLLKNHMSPVGSALVDLLIFRSVLIFFKLNKLQSFRKLHLFSYLCSTEIIPLIILLKIFKTYIGVF